MSDEHRELAVITDPIYGMSEGYIRLRFEVHMASGYSSTLSIDEETASGLIKEAAVNDIHDLNRMVCWLAVRNGCCCYDGMFESALWKQR